MYGISIIVNITKIDKLNVSLQLLRLKHCITGHSDITTDATYIQGIICTYLY